MQLSNFVLENHLSEKELQELEEYAVVDKRYEKMAEIQRAVQENKTKMIISLQETFDKLDQKNSQSPPKLAISKADAFRVTFEQGVFCSYAKIFQIKSLFGIKEKVGECVTKINVNVCNNYRGTAHTSAIPIIPLHIRKSLPNINELYLLWEKNDWQETDRDPALLQHLCKDLFAVLAVWDMTELEHYVLR